jgi:hypothetical protein
MFAPPFGSNSEAKITFTTVSHKMARNLNNPYRSREAPSVVADNEPATPIRGNRASDVIRRSVPVDGGEYVVILDRREHPTPSPLSLGPSVLPPRPTPRLIRFSPIVTRGIDPQAPDRGGVRRDAEGNFILQDYIRWQCSVELDGELVSCGWLLQQIVDRRYHPGDPTSPRRWRLVSFGDCHAIPWDWPDEGFILDDRN